MIGGRSLSLSQKKDRKQREPVAVAPLVLGGVQIN